MGMSCYMYNVYIAHTYRYRKLIMVLKNLSRSKLFGMVINPIGAEDLKWKEMSILEINRKLIELNFLKSEELIKILNNLEIENINKNKTMLKNFVGQLELGKTSNIPHYQVALECQTLCTKRKLLKCLEDKISGHINLEIQFDFDNMKKYCLKESAFISSDYSSKIYKKKWELELLEKKPELKRVLQTPFKWQKFFLEEIISKTAEDRIIDWIIDPKGNTGKSSFARAYVSKKDTDGILMKMDNLDRMELALINKIKSYRDRHNKDPRVIFFDFPRATQPKKMMLATVLVEDAKSGYLESTFGGRHKEIEISNIHIIILSNNSPDLSLLSKDRWRLWRLGGKYFDNIVWPCLAEPVIKDITQKTWYISWTVELKNIPFSCLANYSQYDNLKIDPHWFNLTSKLDRSTQFGSMKEFARPIVSHINNSPNYIKLLAIDMMKKRFKSSVISFNQNDKK